MRGAPVNAKRRTSQQRAVYAGHEVLDCAPDNSGTTR